jgi:hypothetical protein
MPASRYRHALHLIPWFAALMALSTPAPAQQPAHAQAPHAHAHGRLALDVAVDARTLTLRMSSPLDSLLGFERAPRNDAERQRVAQLVTRLQAAGQLFQPDPAAGCALTEVTLSSAVLGLRNKTGAEAKNPPPAPAHDPGQNHRTGQAQSQSHAEDEHADIDVDIVFDCAQATQARHLELQLFQAFPRLRAIDAQIATPRGQFKRSLRPGATRLDLTR